MMFGQKCVLSMILLQATATEGFSPAATIQGRSVCESNPRCSMSSNDAAFSAFAETLEEDMPSKPTKSWQSKLEDVLNPTTNSADRQVLISDLFSSNSEIRESVMDALSKRQIEPLLTPTQKKLQDGTRAVARQITNDILPTISKNRPQPGTLPTMPSPPSFDKVGARLFNVVSNQVQRNLEYLQEDLTDPFNKIPKRLSEQSETLAKEAKNIFLETPEGLSEPNYQTVASYKAYDIRDYDAYLVAETAMEKTEDLATAGNAFNSLAAYLFGANEDQRSMAMTTPVTTTSTGEMRFYLADNDAPQPLDKSKAPINSRSGEIRVMEIPAARFAVRKFTGFVTDGEVSRQKNALLQSLEMDGVELDVPHGAVVPHVIFQYNPPYTLPMVRRNEIAVPVRGRPKEVQDQPDIRKEWDVSFSQDVDDEIDEAIVESLEDQIDEMERTIEVANEKTSEDQDSMPNNDNTTMQ